MEWTIHQIARHAGITSRALRHYDAIGLSLPVIADILDRERDPEAALREHAALLEAERDRLDQRIRAIRHTLDAHRSGTEPIMETMLDGFNDRYREEVIARWGEEAFLASDAWWRGKSVQGQIGWKRESDQLIADWVAAGEDGISPTSERALALAARHVAWLGEIPGTPMAGGGPESALAFVQGLAHLYVEDPGFAATYGGEAGAAFVRDALIAYCQAAT